MVQKRGHQPGGKKEEKKLFLKAMKDIFLEEPASPYVTFDSTGFKQSRELISLDRSGRLVLPKKIRNHFATNRFEISIDNGKIELIPIKPLSSLLGILPDLDIEAIYRDHDREVEEEDADDRSQYPC
jgi:bifunctional DNA-binding transcriptional regulator/antitoxin component of YhaV-PrlF toxin-antitoxin module